MVLGTQNSTSKFGQLNQNDLSDDLQSSSPSNADKIALNIILDDVSLDRVNSIKFLGRHN